MDNTNGLAGPMSIETARMNLMSGETRRVRVGAMSLSCIMVFLS
jgi:hypothetical protein